jgi:glycosyltransferase involved in cell wall biosynthesis
MAHHRLPVFIPAFMEQETIGRVLESIPPQIGVYTTTPVVVDDCSTDATVRIARGYTRHVVVLERNAGVGAATKRGFEYIAQKFPDSDYLIKLDGDGQHDPKLFPRIFRCLQTGSDLVIASRFHADSNDEAAPLDRVLLNRMFASALRELTGWGITDARSGYMGIRMKFVREMAPCLIVQRYGIPMEIALRIWAKNPAARVTELPHPALYGPNISRKLKEKYAAEQITEQSSRILAAYEALLLVLQDLGVDYRKVVEVKRSLHAVA